MEVMSLSCSLYNEGNWGSEGQKALAKVTELRYFSAPPRGPLGPLLADGASQHQGGMTQENGWAY